MFLSLACLCAGALAVLCDVDVSTKSSIDDNVKAAKALQRDLQREISQAEDTSETSDPPRPDTASADRGDTRPPDSDGPRGDDGSATVAANRRAAFRAGAVSPEANTSNERPEVTRQFRKGMGGDGDTWGLPAPPPDLAARPRARDQRPAARLLDMAPAKGGRIHKLRIKNRLCQRHVLVPEGPKYDSGGRVYVGPHARALARRDFARTRRPPLLLPRCCNCCRKSVLGCE